jgi:predicted nucleotidyltransferase
MEWDIEKYIIFETVSGSQMYGTSTPESDIDYRGVAIPPMEVLLDPFHGFEQKDSGFEEEDRTIYSLAKFLKLCADGNPNIIELLFSPHPCWTVCRREWLKLLEYRECFVSKKVKYTFTGYAFSQLHKIEQHRRWFIDPPKEKPTRKMFGLSDSPRISGEGLQAVSNIAFDLLEPAFRDEIRHELEYRNEKQSWDNYIAWFNNRNPKRKALEDKFGYDTKCAMHLFRLMFEGKELLLTGKITFPLEQKDELLEIRRGKYSYEEVIEKARELEKQFEDWYLESKLPYTANWKEIQKLYMSMICK